MLANFSDRTLLSIGVVLCTVAAWFTIGYHHPDEHFQIWEFANYKLGRIPASALPWEFPAQMRSGLQPLLAYSTVLTTKALGIDSPFVQVFLTRLLCGLAALLVYWKWSIWLKRDLKNPDNIRWMRIGLLFFWLMPYLNVRFSSENTSAICFFGGLLLLVQQLGHQKNKFRWEMMAAGFLICLSFFFRYQIAFAIVGLGAWLFTQNKPGLIQWVALTSGAILALGLGVSADFWLYDEWVCAPYNYFATTVLHSDDRFGTQPWWWYFSEAALAFLPPLSILLLVFVALGIRQKPLHVLIWCFLPFVITHLVVGHKEIRFLFPMVLPFFFLSVSGWEYFQEKYKVTNWMGRAFRFCLWLNLIVLLFRIIIPAKEMAAYAKFLWSWNEEHPGSTVYFVHKEPQNDPSMHMSFYDHPNQSQRYWYSDPIYKNDTSNLHAGDLMIFKEKSAPTPEAPRGFRLERKYVYYPELLLRNNTNDWQSRTHIWAIYQLVE